MRWLSCSLVLAACGPIYSNPPQQQQQPQPQYQSGPPGGGADPWQGQGQDDNARGGEWTNDPAPAPPPPPSPARTPTRPAAPPAPSNIPPQMAAILAAHNTYRAKHCAPALTWSPKLAAAAQQWASSLKSQGCKFGHKPNNQFGENLAAGTSGTLDGQAVADMWYDEIKLYKFPNGGFSMQTGHFTQVVWRETTQLGCGTVTCNGMDIWVCEYDPPGNVETEYRQNVQPTGCR